MSESGEGFSKLTKIQKIQEIVKDSNLEEKNFIKFWSHDDEFQKVIDEISENVISNFVLPFSIAPHFRINDSEYNIPMVIEESSVVAAASSSAKFWRNRGGFKTKVLNNIKTGQIHFEWIGDTEKMISFFDKVKGQLIESTNSITQNMRSRGGGILGIEICDLTDKLKNYYQIDVTFKTADAMGANFINTNLEQIANNFVRLIKDESLFDESEKNALVIMSILSNYTPDCIVRSSVMCPIEELKDLNIKNPYEFAEKFCRAIEVAKIDRKRAVTHNKGIMNGVDAVVIATGNDFRAVEACAHAYASKSGEYVSLTNAEIDEGVFKFWIDLPISIGTVGGLTSFHPMAKASLTILNQPSAEDLMGIIASVGLASNFAAIKSLVTTGIQKGHMKLHLSNICNQLGVSEIEKGKITQAFATEVVSFSEVKEVLNQLRGSKR